MMAASGGRWPTVTRHTRRIPRYRPHDDASPALNRSSANNEQRRRRASRTDIDPLLGQRIDGDFEIERPLGVGSHADVFLARQRSVGGRRVALKILSRLHLSLREADFRRAAMALLREGELLGGLHSACFVDVYRTGILPDERPYLAMEYVEGQTLAAMIADGNTLPIDVVVDIMTGLGTGLAELHGTGMVHRDVTPANLIVTRDPTGSLEVRMFDFGTVTKVSRRADRHRMGYDPEHPLGTAAYMSPEQAAAGVVDGRSDQFAVASIGYEMLAGHRPFDVADSGPRPLLEYLRGDGPIPARSLAELRSVPDLLGEAIHRAMRRDAALRFPTMVEFVEAMVTVRRRALAATGKHQKTLFGRLLGGSK